MKGNVTVRFIPFLLTAAVVLATLGLLVPSGAAPAQADSHCAVPSSVSAAEPGYGQITAALNAAGFNGLFPGHQYFGLQAMWTGPSGNLSLSSPYAPPTLLKAIGWIESSWIQADYSVPRGDVGSPLISFDCGYGIMQITAPGVPLDGIAWSMYSPPAPEPIYSQVQVPIATSYTHNIDFGAKTLIGKWNVTPSIGNNDPYLVESWYYALWAYNGFSSTNDPSLKDPLRGEYRCDGTQSRGQFPYQELTLGCVKYPPVVGGIQMWSPVGVTLPPDSSFETSWGAIPTPQPAHTDPTSGTKPLSVVIDDPASGVIPKQPFVFDGWAVDYAASSGTGIDGVHIYAYPSDPQGDNTGAPLFLGAAALGGSRPDVATSSGNPNFVPSGYGLVVKGLNPGFYRLVAYAHSTVTGQWYEAHRVSRLEIQDMYNWLLHSRTPLEETTSQQWSFATADFDRDGWGDLIGVKMNGTGCGRTEVHVLSGSSGLQQWKLHACTPLEATEPGQWSFAAGDWNRDGVPDLLAVKKNSTGCSRTEVHILSGAANFGQWLLRACTALGTVSSDQWTFGAGDYDGDGVPDLLGINMSGTGCGRTEVHVMSGATNFGQWLLQGCTGLDNTNSDWTFGMSDYDGDGRSDLYTIRMRNTGTGSTEVHVLSAASRYGQFTLHTGSALHTTTPEQWAFNIARFNQNGFPAVIAIKMNGTGTATEVHVLGR